MLKNKISLLFLVQLSISFIPFSLILGSLIINLNILIFLILGLVYLQKIKFNIKINHTNLFFFAFLLSIIFSSIKNVELIGSENLIKSIILLKFFLFYVVLESLIINTKINLKYFFIFSFFLLFFVSLDVLLQFFRGKNILGYEPWEGRITGIFEHEAIVGAYLQKNFLFSIIGILLINFSKKTNIFIAFYSFIILFSCYVSSNRISFLLLLLIFLILIILFKFLRKYLLISFIIFLPISIYLFNTNEQINYKIKNFKVNIERIFNIGYQNNNNLAVFSSDYKKLYKTAYNTFKENELFGNGYKSFRYKCYTIMHDDPNRVCSTHPHNYYLEILNQSGFIGLIFFLLFIIFLIKNSLKKLKSYHVDSYQKYFSMLLLLNIIIEIFPLKSSGSLFTTWNGSIFWISCAFVNYLIYEKKNYNK